MPPLPSHDFRQSLQDDALLVYFHCTEPNRCSLSTPGLRPDAPETAPSSALRLDTAEPLPARGERGAVAAAPDAAATAAGGAASADPDDEAAVCGALFRGLVFFLGREVRPQTLLLGKVT